MDIDNILRGLKQLQSANIKTLDIYWLEDNEPDDPFWWVDVMNDDLNDLCQTNWIWTVMSREEYDNEEPDESTGFEGGWFIIEEEQKFSDDLVHDIIKRWLRDRGFMFDVRVIDSAGTEGEKRVSDMLNRHVGEREEVDCDGN